MCFFDLFACILGSDQAQCGARPRMLGAKKAWCQFSTHRTQPTAIFDFHEKKTQGVFTSRC